MGGRVDGWEGASESGQIGGQGWLPQGRAKGVLSPIFLFVCIFFSVSVFENLHTCVEYVYLYM